MLVGRGRECTRVDDLLARARRGRSGGLVLRGEAGIGKTALLDYAVAGAEDMTVLRAVGLESEAELRFSGLLELLRPLSHLFPEIPPQQADVLRSALGLGAPEELDRFTIGVAVLNVIGVAAESRPLLVLVDDAQWLDRATADTLRFVAKRLVADRVAALVTVRDDEPSGMSFELPGLDRLDVRGLSGEEAVELLGAAGIATAREVADRLCEGTRGNPLAILETCRRLSAEQLDGRAPLPEPLPAGPTLERAFARRLELLPDASRRALLVAVVSLLRKCAVDTIASALAAFGLDTDALEPAEDAGLITIADGGIVFQHPLVRSAVYHGAAASERRAAHRALAMSLESHDELECRAWHLAGAALGHDEQAASALDLAARQAWDRSAYPAAAAALTRAARLTDDESRRMSMLHRAAQAAFRAGRGEEAAELLAEPGRRASDRRTRTEALRLLGRIEYLAGRASAAGALLLEAAELAAAFDVPLAVELCAESCTTQQIVGDTTSMVATAERGRALSDTSSEGDVKRLGTFTFGWVLCCAGRPREGLPVVEKFADAPVDLERELDPLRVLRSSVALDWLDRSDEALSHVRGAVEEARARGAVGLLPYMLLQQAWHAARAGLLNDGAAAAAEALGLAREFELRLPTMHALLVLTAIAARRGDEEQCRTHADEVGPLAEQAGLHGFVVWRRYSLGVLELALGRLDASAREFEQAARQLDERSSHSPSFIPRAELAEVYARADRTADAERAIAAFAASPEADSTLGRAAAARARGLLASNEQFVDHFDEALGALAHSSDRWSLARTRLCFGERLRRAGRRVDARRELRLALEAFEAVGAGVWAERARVELRATGETLRRRKAWEGEQLTPQEFQIALHVARGMTNREAATALFLSHKTIEFHLGRIYRKLGITSRAQLISRLGTVAREAEAALS
ncbi:MAG: ATP-binding protein [Gaiellaceae bacterium]